MSNVSQLIQAGLLLFRNIFKTIRLGLLFKKKKNFFFLKFNSRNDPIWVGIIFSLYKQGNLDLKRFNNLSTFTKELRKRFQEGTSTNRGKKFEWVTKASWGK